MQGACIFCGLSVNGNPCSTHPRVSIARMAADVAWLATASRISRWGTMESAANSNVCTPSDAADRRDRVPLRVLRLCSLGRTILPQFPSTAAMRRLPPALG